MAERFKQLSSARYFAEILKSLKLANDTTADGLQQSGWCYGRNKSIY